MKIQFTLIALTLSAVLLLCGHVHQKYPLQTAIRLTLSPQNKISQNYPIASILKMT